VTFDDALKAGFGVLLAGLSAAVGWLLSSVLGSREKVKTLEMRVKALEVAQLSKEDVRQVVDAALDRYAAGAASRREQWDRALTAEIRQLVLESAARSLTESRNEVQKIVPMLVHEVCNSCPNRENGD
jgi:BMFP domain-containing protein YqiC